MISFSILMIHEAFPGVMRGPTQNLDPNGLAVLTFGYKQTDKQSIYTDIYIRIRYKTLENKFKYLKYLRN